jgi:hypothetical protein
MGQKREITRRMVVLSSTYTPKLSKISIRVARLVTIRCSNTFMRIIFTSTFQTTLHLADKTQKFRSVARFADITMTNVSYKICTYVCLPTTT